jgi:hypothetical protein
MIRGGVRRTIGVAFKRNFGHGDGQSLAGYRSAWIAEHIGRISPPFVAK